eukprot:13262919-Ditylum_brightwellii.AAC.1
MDRRAIGIYTVGSMTGFVLRDYSKVTITGKIAIIATSHAALGIFEKLGRRDSSVAVETKMVVTVTGMMGMSHIPYLVL